MTSFPKRIGKVKDAIERFMKTQTVKPDRFYLWLAESEFPNKESDLPATLMRCLIDNKVILEWTPNNEYCHKRWYVYPKHYADTVIAIDDDQIYPPNLIEQCQQKIAEDPKRILVVARTEFKKLVFNSYLPEELLTEETDINTPSFCGQCCFPPSTFPLEAVRTENIWIRDMLTPKCDECWLLPWLIKTGKYHIGTIDALNDYDDGETALWKELRSYDLTTWRENKFEVLYKVIDKIGAYSEARKVWGEGYTMPPKQPKPQVVLAIEWGPYESVDVVKRLIASANNGTYKPDIIYCRNCTIPFAFTDELMVTQLDLKDKFVIRVSTNYCEFRPDTIETLIRTYLANQTHCSSVVGNEYRKYPTNPPFISPRVWAVDHRKIEPNEYFIPHTGLSRLARCKFYIKDYVVAETSVDNVTEEFENSTPEFKEICHAYPLTEN